MPIKYKITEFFIHDIKKYLIFIKNDFKRAQYRMFIESLSSLLWNL